MSKIRSMKIKPVRKVEVSDLNQVMRENLKLSYTQLMELQSCGTMKYISTCRILSGKMTFKIARLIKDLNVYMEIFENRRIDLLKKFGKKDENGDYVKDGTNFVFDGDNERLFSEEFAKLESEVIELNYPKVLLDLETLPSGVFSPVDLINLEPIFEFQNSD